MIIKQTINNLAHKYRIDLQASLTCLYNTPEINELTPEQMQDILFILERIKCGRAAVYPEFLKGYQTLCFKINMNRVPLRIFIYKRISDGIQIIVDKFSVHKNLITSLFGRDLY